MNLRQSLKSVLEKLSASIKGSSYINRDAFFGFDGVIIRGKKIILYCIIYDFNYVLKDIPETDVPKATLIRWDRYKRLFGPIPLAIVLSTPTQLLVKRISASWDSEYEEDTTRESIKIPSDGYVELQAA
jgi:hypothetical protein